MKEEHQSLPMQHRPSTQRPPRVQEPPRGPESAVSRQRPASELPQQFHPPQGSSHGRRKSVQFTSPLEQEVLPRNVPNNVKSTQGQDGRYQAVTPNRQYGALKPTYQQRMPVSSAKTAQLQTPYGPNARVFVEELRTAVEKIGVDKIRSDQAARREESARDMEEEIEKIEAEKERLLSELRQGEEYLRSSMGR